MLKNLIINIKFLKNLNKGSKSHIVYQYISNMADQNF